jgi:septum formation protein
LLLASASPRRRELLTQLGVAFAVVVAEVTEHEEPSTDPREMVSHNAALKAEWVANRSPDALVLGADTTVSIDRMALNKPRDLAEARAMLRRLSGRTHQVYTGIAARRRRDELRMDEVVTSEVVFRTLTDDDIAHYLAKVNVLDKAGAYAIQDHGELIVAGHRGSLSNVIGLPLESTKQILTQCGLLG